MNKETLKRLRELSASATKGPWTWFDVRGEFEVVLGPGFNPEYPSIDPMLVMDDGSSGGEYAKEITSDSANGKLLVEMRNALDPLLDHIENLERVVEAAKELMAIESHEDCEPFQSQRKILEQALVDLE